jgi:hypothetical protein
MTETDLLSPAEAEAARDVATVTKMTSTTIMGAEAFDRVWRMSKALAQSGSFKDIGQQDAPKALARILLGADLGMTPTQALMGIDIVKGNPQIRGVALGRMVRNSARQPTPTGESYDYAILDRGFERGKEFAVVALYRRDDDGSWPMVPEGASVTFPTSVGSIVVESKPHQKPERRPEAVEAFTVGQANTRGLIKDAGGAWKDQPEVMVVWRALSQLVRFYAPDVIGGMSVYTEADGLDAVEGSALGAPAAGPQEDQPIGWGAMSAQQIKDVEAIVARARRLEHGGITLRNAQQALAGQNATYVEGWKKSATGILDKFERDHPPEPEPEDADVVPETPDREAITTAFRQVEANELAGEALDRPFDLEESRLLDRLEEAANANDATAYALAEAELADLRARQDATAPEDLDDDTLPGF